ncbi:MAG TPA: Flp family type IVb pilin, partial [Aggregatilineaceae bacterium]|nr:Flp family type IVb pilin [Aggregatilineaceae bacterium]
MSGHKVNQVHPPRRVLFWFRRASGSRTGGQALLEYALILVLVAIALIAVLTITGPAVGNVFSNTVFNLLGGTVEPRDTLSA